MKPKVPFAILTSLSLVGAATFAQQQTLTRLAILDDSQQSVVVDERTASEDMVPVLTLPTGEDVPPEHVGRGYVARSERISEVTAGRGGNWHASQLQGEDGEVSAYLLRQKAVEGSPVEVKVRWRNPNFEWFQTEDSDMDELYRATLFDHIDLDMPNVSSRGLITTLIQHTDIAVRPPRGGFPDDRIRVQAEAHPFALLHAIAETFGMELKLRGKVWEFRGEPSLAQHQPKEKTPQPIKTELDIEMERLSALQPEPIEFEGMQLSRALLVLALRSGISLALPDAEMPDATVTLIDRRNPFETLRMLTSRYGLGLEYADSVWNIFPIDIHEVVPRTYEIQHNDLLEIKVTAPDLSTNLSNRGAGMGAGGASMAMGPIGSGGKDTFEVVAEDDNPLIKRLNTALALPTTGLRANRDALNYIARNGGEIPPPSVSSRIWGRSAEALMQQQGGAPEGRIHYTPANGTLVIYASRQQHEYIEEIINAMDQPQRLIHYQGYIFETNLNPTTNFGMDWSPTNSQGVSLSDYVGPTVNDGFRFGQAILDAPTLTAQINFLMGNSQTKLTSQPYGTARAMQSVELAAMEQRPISSSRFESTAAAGTIASQLDYIRIGTSINAFGRVLNGKINGREAIELYVVITVSDRSGDVLIDENLAPIVNERTYNFTAVVPNGFSLAIGGITREFESETVNNVPLLGSIPLVGYAFKNRSTVKENVNLVAYITPTLLNDKDGNMELEKAMPDGIEVGPNLQLISLKP